jgi:Domain of unknown function (DUF4258)
VIEMLSLGDICAQFLRGEQETSVHAAERMVERSIVMSEVIEAMTNAECIEKYPDDKYSPSMLILGFTIQQRPLHIHVSASVRRRVKIITVYEPNPEEWLYSRIRKKA